MYQFRNDYSVGCHPVVLEALATANTEHIVGYGADQYCKESADMIRSLCRTPKATVEFIAGGTQTNLTAVAAFLRPWESVISPASGHINGHEAGAVEATGHKILTVSTMSNGKLTPAMLQPTLDECKDEHLTKPHMVYISNATETGSVYTKAELTELSAFCKKNDLLLFMDGARLGCALTSQANDLTLPDIAELTDAFYIGGTKNGAMFGEALVIVNPALQKDFFRVKKQCGAVLAKGWLLGLQFKALFKDGLYFKIAKHAVDVAQYLQGGLKNLGIPMMIDSPTNQIFPIVPNSLLPRLDKLCSYEVWCKADDEHTVIRLVTSFATPLDSAEGFLKTIREISQI